MADIDNLIQNNDLSLGSVYSEYPKSFLPNKFKPPTGEKAKRALVEEIDENLYEEAAHMVAFRTVLSKLPAWIKSLALLYYEHYGKSKTHEVYWFDDPIGWSTKSSGNKAICIELSTKSDVENPLLYKITLFINTGLFQVQGNHKDTFVNKDCPVLLSLTDKIVEYNKENPTQSVSDTCTSIETSDTNVKVCTNTKSDTSLTILHQSNLLLV